jgi:hypothetical protein
MYFPGGVRNKLNGNATALEVQAYRSQHHLHLGNLPDAIFLWKTPNAIRGHHYR